MEWSSGSLLHGIKSENFIWQLDEEILRAVWECVLLL